MSYAAAAAAGPAVSVPMTECASPPRGADGLRPSTAPFLGHPERDWEAHEPLIPDRNFNKHGRFLSFDDGKAERSFLPRRAGLGLALLLVILVCVDLWRGMPGSAVVSETQDTLAKEASSNEVAATTTTTVVVDRFGYNSTEKTVILFVHHDTPDANANTRFFLEHALHDRADFVFILNGPSELQDEIPTHLPNVRVVERPNTCYDLGAHGEVLQANERELVRTYDKFILMNASVRGPFMPRWSQECWTNAFTDKVTDRVKLVGLTMNCYNGRDHSFAIKPTDKGFDPVHRLRHIQAMLLATDKAGVSLLLDPVGLGACHSDYKSAVATELHLSSLVWAGGFEVEAVMNMWGEVDDFAENCVSGNPTMKYPGGYLPLTESMFAKTKKLPKGVAETYSKWARKYSSYEHCPVY